MPPVNRPNPRYKLQRLAFIASLLFPAASLLAQADFRVTPGTGLELDSGSPKTAPGKKTNPAPVAEKKATEITCTGETTFDAKAGVAVFIKDVKVNDPQFSLVADKLTAYLKKTPKEPVKSGTSATPTPTPTPAPAAKPEEGTSPASGLDRAVAEGNVTIIQDKVDEKTGELTHYIGKGAKADYNAKTGEMTLSGWPQIQQGLNNQVATEEGTIMIMTSDGHLMTHGPTKTVIQSETKPAKAEKPAKTGTSTLGNLKLP